MFLAFSVLEIIFVSLVTGAQWSDRENFRYDW